MLHEFQRYQPQKPHRRLFFDAVFAVFHSNLRRERCYKMHSPFITESVKQSENFLKLSDTEKQAMAEKAFIEYGSAVEPILNLGALHERILHNQEMADARHMPKTFYVIKRIGDYGLFSFVSWVFCHICYAFTKGYVPVIDLQTVKNPFLEDEKVGLENAWEFYFKQPYGYSLNDAEKAWETGNCVFSEFEGFPPQLTTSICSVAMNPSNYFREWVLLYKHFFNLNDSVENYISDKFNSIIKPNMRTIGVHCRGTDYTGMAPSLHARQPKVEDVIEKVKSAMQEWDCEYIFIATDERKTLNAFESAFPKRVLYSDEMYYDELETDYSKQFLTKAAFDRPDDRYLKGLDYLTSIMILSKCTSAVIGINNGSMAALYINGGRYENVHIYDLGVY